MPVQSTTSQPVEGESGAEVRVSGGGCHKSTSWHIITPEFPPRLGGVADYACQLAEALRHASGCPVHVWARGEALGTSPAVQVHSLGDEIRPASLRRVSNQLDEIPGRKRILVQWVPHGYGYQSMNVPFCWWLLQRALQGDIVEVMVHEPFLRFREGSWRQDVAAAVHRIMICLVLRAASRVWVSTLDWVAELRPWAFGRNLGFGWLPVPNNIPVCDSPDEVQAVRAAIGSPGQSIIGHFGTFGAGVRQMLESLLPCLLLVPDTHILLVGPGSSEFREVLLTRYPGQRSQLHATGALAPRELSLHLSACDLMLQPYPDGVNGRRGSVMAALAHRKPVVTTAGRATEPVWRGRDAVLLGNWSDPDSLTRQISALLDDRAARAELAERGFELYKTRFDLKHTVEALLRPI